MQLLRRDSSVPFFWETGGDGAGDFGEKQRGSAVKMRRCIGKGLKLVGIYGNSKKEYLYKISF
jgi:hypothetical protein